MHVSCTHACMYVTAPCHSVQMQVQMQVLHASFRVSNTVHQPDSRARTLLHTLALAYSCAEGESGRRASGLQHQPPDIKLFTFIPHAATSLIQSKRRMQSKFCPLKVMVRRIVRCFYAVVNEVVRSVCLWIVCDVTVCGGVMIVIVAIVPIGDDG